MNRQSSNGGTRLYVGNLPYDMTGDELVGEFAGLGFTVTRPHIVMDKETGRGKGFAFVEAASSADAANIVSQCNGAVIGGRTVRVDHAVDRPRGDRPRQSAR